MVSITYPGRLGNNLLQYAAAYIFAKKFGFKIYSNEPNCLFGLPTLMPDSKEDSNLPIIDVTDYNFMQLLESEKLETAHYRFIHYYQLKEFILKYRDEIKSLFCLNYSQMNENEVFVAYRIGDQENRREMLPIEYYREALQKIKPESGYITSDTMSHSNVLQIAKEFNLKFYINNNPSEKINFAKNFNNLVLSEGTFSWWIGFLSRANTIFYNKRDRFWHGDIFVFDNWKYLSYDWHPDCFDSYNKLICKTVVRDFSTL